MAENIVFIGGGNMARSLIGGLLQAQHPQQNLFVVDPNTQARQLLRSQFDIAIESTAEKVLSQADVVLLAVKPQVLKEVCVELAPIFRQRPCLVISIVAGIKLSSINHWLGGDYPIVRVMPNTPALIGEGASGLYANPKVSEKQKEIAQNIVSAVGTTVWVSSEKLLNVVTALSGSGPAYHFYFMEIMIRWATAAGLPENIAKTLTLNTAKGAALMALSNDMEVDELRRQVTSKGGTTEAALKSLESENLERLLSRALEAANQRADQLAKELGESQ